MKNTSLILMIAITLLLAIGTVSAVGLPTVDFTGTPTTGEVPLVVNFNKITANTSPAIYTWTFGDGWSLTGASVSHTYQTPGKYTVALEMDGFGWGYTMSKTDYIIVTHVKPVAAFTYVAEHTPQAAPLNVTFDSSATTGEHVEYLWDFGDGTSSTAANPTHRYTSEGIYTIILTASNDGGNTTATHPVTVLPEKPDAHIGADSATTGAVPLAVQFKDMSEGVGISTWSWAFGDGQVSTQQNPLHAYGSVGTYDVSLTVTSPSGSDTTIQYHYVRVTLPVEPTVCPTPSPTPVPTICPIPNVPQVTNIGVFRGDGQWYTRNTNTGGLPDASFIYGTTGDIPLLGDWNGDGILTPGVFRNGMFYLRNSNSGGVPDISFSYGAIAGDIPVTGDWNADGIDTIGIIRNGAFYLRNSNTNGLPDIVFGQTGDVSVIEH